MTRTTTGPRSGFVSDLWLTGLILSALIFAPTLDPVNGVLLLVYAALFTNAINGWARPPLRAIRAWVAVWGAHVEQGR